MRAILALLSAVAAFGVIYLLCAFVAWNLNPGDWNTQARFFCALFGIDGECK
jgi:hypothetical protein